jgi:hypothetical protein
MLPRRRQHIGKGKDGESAGQGKIDLPLLGPSIQDLPVGTIKDVSLVV